MTDTITIPQVTDSGAVRGMMYALRGRYRFLDTIPIGRSVLGREIFGLLLGGGNGPEKVLFAAAFHGQEWLTALTVLRLCEDICEAMQKDGKLDDLDLRQALAGRSLILVPMVNPDGVDIALRGAEAAGPFAEQAAALGADRPGLWQANARGVDINHNFNAGWALLQELERKKGIDGPAPRQWGGPCPESEPETRALTGLCARFRFRHVVALHSQGEEIYWRYGDRTPPQAQMMADVLGLPVQTVQVPESPALGAAILAGVAAGVYPDVPSASAALVVPGEPLLPDAERSAAYEPYYRLYESLYPALKPACGRLAAL